MPGCPTVETPVLRRLHVGKDVNFYQSVTGRVVLSADDRGGARGRAFDDDGGFLKIGRSAPA